MKEYIEREALVKTTRETQFTMSMCLPAEECRGMNRARNILADIFEILPAADVREVVRGEWKPVMCTGNPNIQDRDEWYGPLYVCDKCNWTMIGKSNFCPNCGADMRGEE